MIECRDEQTDRTDRNRTGTEPEPEPDCAGKRNRNRTAGSSTGSVPVPVPNPVLVGSSHLEPVSEKGNVFLDFFLQKWSQA